jgi:chromosome segregation ATPase
LEQRISELVDSQKKCQDEKSIVEAALQDSTKDLVKLKKTHEDDLNLIENLRKDLDKNAKTIDEVRDSNVQLSMKNSDLAKALSGKEKKIKILRRLYLSETSL